MAGILEEPGNSSGFVILVTGNNRAGKTTLSRVLFEMLQQLHPVTHKSPIVLVTGSDLRSLEPQHPSRATEDADIRVGGVFKDTKATLTPEDLSEAMQSVSKFVLGGGVAIVNYRCRTPQHRNSFFTKFSRVVWIHLQMPSWDVWVKRNHVEDHGLLTEAEQAELKRIYDNYVRDYEEPQENDKDRKPDLVLTPATQSIPEELSCVNEVLVQRGFLPASGTHETVQPKINPKNTTLARGLLLSLASKFREENVLGLIVDEAQYTLVIPTVLVAGFFTRITIAFEEQDYSKLAGIDPLLFCHVRCELPFVVEQNDPAVFFQNLLKRNGICTPGFFFQIDSDGQPVWCMRLVVTNEWPSVEVLRKLLALHNSTLHRFLPELVAAKCTSEKDRRMLEVMREAAQHYDALKKVAESPSASVPVGEALRDIVKQLVASIEERPTGKKAQSS